MTNWKVGQVQVKIGGFKPATPAGAAGSPTPQVRLAEIQAAAQARDFPRAATLAEAALQAGVEHPMVLNLAALKAEQEGRFEDALRVLDRAVAIAPADIGAHNARGLVLARLERYADALATFDTVVAMQPNFAGAHCARGAALESMGRLAEAEAAYRHAENLQPENLGAVQGLANLLSRRGEFAVARELAEDVLDTEPNFPDAVMVLAAADAAEGAGERARERLGLLIGDARLTPHQKAIAQGQLGDVLDVQGLSGPAVQAYTACNEGLRQAYAPVYGERPGALAFARGMLAELDAIPTDAWTAPAAPAAEDPRHVFLMGFPRSGVALVQQLLSRHPDASVVVERDTLIDAQRAFQMQPADVARLARAGEAELAALRDAYWARVRTEGADPSRSVLVDANALNTFSLPIVLKLFPQATVLIAERDPRDVVLSAWRRRFRMSAPSYELLTLPGTAAYYDASQSIAQRLAPAMDGRLVTVRQEALLEDFDGAAGALLAALGLTWNDAVRDYAEAAYDRAVTAPNGLSISRGPCAEGVSAWRRYPEPLAAVSPVLDPWVRRLGYPAA